ncbi:hypothetical protein ACGTZG_03195 [Megasphaera hexanoica]|uniref:Uncharacterized protein n=1 Tax=Megasphaera hexanoica TaxID=1675036 RepID=A0ABW7DMG2_9FIRM
MKGSLCLSGVTVSCRFLREFPPIQLFQSLGRGQIPHAFSDGHQVIPFLSEEDIAAAPLPPSGCRSSFDSSPLGTC